MVGKKRATLWRPLVIQLGNFEHHPVLDPDFNHVNRIYLVGGISTPLKNMSSSIGMMTFPIYGKIKVMFQTTNQVNKLDFTMIPPARKKCGMISILHLAWFKRGIQSRCGFHHVFTSLNQAKCKEMRIFYQIWHHHHQAFGCLGCVSGKRIWSWYWSLPWKVWKSHFHHQKRVVKSTN